MNVLGLSAFYHDSAAALVRNGVVVAAAQQERFSRRKNDAGFPGDAVSYCLDSAGLDLDGIDYVGFYDKPLLTFSRLLETYMYDDQKDQEKIDTAKFRIDTMYSFMDHEFEQQPFANGDNFTMSDCAAAPALFYAELLAPFTEYENICAYWERLKERASVRRTHADARPIFEDFMGKNAA